MSSSCACSSALLGGRDETAQKSIDIIESLGIPVVVLYSPNCYEDSDPTAISEEIRIIGQVFGEDESAEKIISGLIRIQRRYGREHRTYPKGKNQLC